MSRTKKVIVALLAAMTLGAFFAPISSAAADCRPGPEREPAAGLQAGQLQLAPSATPGLEGLASRWSRRLARGAWAPRL